ncbi:hypothetical protein KUTeg_022682 [Tegillarca granosa]|uniref:Uncharacterized protein n=1 Tax=Tegillarca granosa TaxID=220873 RepID=A0ABQ9E419_TEGGR|nr:hypothetical protein KUTeg_022682 [Tegillarca granosa]
MLNSYEFALNMHVFSKQLQFWKKTDVSLNGKHLEITENGNIPNLLTPKVVRNPMFESKVFIRLLRSYIFFPYTVGMHKECAVNTTACKHLKMCLFNHLLIQ